MTASLELFCGTKSFSKIAEKRFGVTWTADIDSRFHPDVLVDVLKMDPLKWRKMSFLWMSPPCEAFSTASISHHWKGGKGAYIPKDEAARTGIGILEKCADFIQISRPRFWVLENPRCVTRKILGPILDKRKIPYIRRTVTYCRYGDKRMKPTDLFSNIPFSRWSSRPMCHNGDSCHEAAPRGSKTGTQGLKNAVERGRIPSALIREILDSCGF